jgi:hypothetical protein
LKLFTLRALDQAGGAGETTRRFVMNFSPDSWWAGPDPDLFPPADPSDPYSDGEYNSRSVMVTHWPNESEPSLDTDPPLPQGTFGVDSMQYRPSMRMPPGNDFTRPGTFYEFYKDRIYARTEGDTVHMNSWIILWNGGYDKDSRYTIRADSTDPALLGPGGTYLTGLAIQSAGKVGSPVGFRSWIVSRLTPAGVKVAPAQSALYPVYLPKSVFRAARMGGYWRMFQAGKAYALARAEDADGGTDGSIVDPATLVDDIESGGGTPTEQALRRKVIVFYVDKAPALVGTVPRNNQTINTVQWNVALEGMDLDPYDQSIAGWRAGGPTPNEIIRYRLSLYGKNLAGRDTSWQYLESNGLPYIERGSSVAISFVPGGTGSMAGNPFATGKIRMSIEICDCIDCENTPGQGRCVQGIDPATGAVLNASNVITINYTRPASAADLSTSGERPGPESAGGGE